MAHNGSPGESSSRTRPNLVPPIASESDNRASQDTASQSLSIASYYYDLTESQDTSNQSTEPSILNANRDTDSQLHHRSSDNPRGWTPQQLDRISPTPRLLDDAFSLQPSPRLPARSTLHIEPTRIGSHGRVVSSATEGDVGIYQIMHHAADSNSSLNLELARNAPRPADSASLPETPMDEVLGHESQNMDESDTAGLTSNSMQMGWANVENGQHIVQSPEMVSGVGTDTPRGYFDITSDDKPSDQAMNRNAYQSSADNFTGLNAANEYSNSKKAQDGWTSLGKSIRRMSRRVINLDNGNRPTRDGRIRLPDNDDDENDNPGLITIQQFAVEPVIQELRGKSLGIFGPTSRIRQALVSLMTKWWIEPLILIMILFNVVLLIIQSAPSVFDKPRKPGWFDYWVDYALLSVFVVYTMEILARIIVSGLVINPPPAYEPPKDHEEQRTEDAGVSTSTHARGDPRKKTSRSNTLDTFAVFGESMRNRANVVMRPEARLHAGGATSPNRTQPPRTVSSDYLQENDYQENPNLRKIRQATDHTQTSALLQDKTSKFLQKSRLAPFAHAIVLQRAQAVDYAFLRHSWNRIDFIAIVSFWIAFILAIFHQEDSPSHHIYIFRALSTLRSARLLTATRGTSVILQSLKTAGPLLVNVAFFTVFSMLLFSIIGVQSFEGNYKRSCVWVGDLQKGVEYAPGVNYTLQQMCGGFYDAITGERRKPLRMDGAPLSLSIKGFICPQGQLCVEAEENPENNSESFDNIFEALLQVVIVISSNGWSDIMYNMIDADYFASCLYFIIGIIIMNFWMANLFVAVITNTFATISAETKQSAFAAERIEPTKPKLNENPSNAFRRRKRAAHVFKRIWSYTKYLWLALIIADLGVQASQASYKRSAENQQLGLAELYLTIAFDVEILLRFFSFLLDMDWRSFFANYRNRFDLFLAIVTTIIQIPQVKNSSVYSWLTAFQLARFYRVIAAVPRMEALLIRVFGSMSGLFNMILFLLMMVGVASLIAVQLFRGDIPQMDDGESTEINFKQIYNTYLGMYQIFSSENWTTVLYSAIGSEGQYKQAVIAAIFLCAWFLFANFIVLQMFIAVIAENFGVAESQKRSQQLELYLRNLEKPRTSFFARLLHHLSPYRWLREHNAAKMGVATEKGHKSIAQKAIDALDEKNRKRKSFHGIVDTDRAHNTLQIIRRALRLDRPEETVPLDTIRARQLHQSFSRASMLSGQRGQSLYENNPSSLLQASSDDTARLFARDRQLSRMRSDLGLINEEPLNQAEIDEEHANRWKDDPRMIQARMINTHPSYEKSLWLFSNTNPFRRLCQSFVPCSYGERLFGRKTSVVRQRIYQGLIFATIAASVIIAGYATPKYRRDWYAANGMRRDSWFSLTEVTLSIIFIAEFFVKVIADGFAFTPNAYLLSSWNALDLFVLCTLVVNVTTELAVIGGVSRFTRAIKAFRALRLINLSDLMRRTFSGLVAGADRFIDASVLAILYIVPFAIWGQNLFSGVLYSCTDDSSNILKKSDCVGEYGASPSEWTFLAPRAWQNPTEGSMYSFDDFRSSLLILFEIVSLEGWINVMTTAMSVTGFNNQLQTDASQVNALFFVIYNLIGAVFVLTLFVAVIIESFQAFSGAAYRTTQQRQWIDLKRLIARQRPSKRPRIRPSDALRGWCYDRAVDKNGWWSRCMTLSYLASLITLATQTYGDSLTHERTRDIVYIVVATMFAIDILVRLSGLGWRAFRQDVWNMFDLIVVAGTLATSIPLLTPRSDNMANLQLQKIFLVAVAFKLVQRNNALNQLFKTAISSLPSIASLFLLWLTMFLVWGIMIVEVFGLTKWGINETYSKNFSSLLGSLVFLSMMSTGEGWNSYMHDYTLSPPLCTPSSNYLNTDCGSEGWAYFLFIGWNVISMYIFLNMFTGTVVENFSYVFQLGGKPTLSREQVRNFKQAWTEFDENRSGYLPKEKFVPFFNRLRGSMEVRVHPTEGTISALLSKASKNGGSRPNSFGTSSHEGHSPLREAAQRLRLRSPAHSDEGKGHFMWPPSPEDHVVDGVSITSLNAQLNSLDLSEIRRRQHRFERIYHEAVIIQEKPQNRAKGGISFTDMLTLIAHYKLIDDEQALSLEELVERRELLQIVEDRIETERVRGFLLQLWLRRRFQAMRRERLRISATSNQALSVPSQHLDLPEVSANNRSSSHLASSSPRDKPKLTLNLQDINSPPQTPTNPVHSFDTITHSPGRTRILREAEKDADGPNIHLTTTDDASSSLDEDDYDQNDERKSLSPRSLDRHRNQSTGELSPSTSLQGSDRRNSPILPEMDDSIWGAVGRRLSAGNALLERETDGSTHSPSSQMSNQSYEVPFFSSQLQQQSHDPRTSPHSAEMRQLQPAFDSETGSLPSSNRSLNSNS